MERIDAARLALAPLSLSREAAELDGLEVKALLFRAAPGAYFGDGFTAEDGPFCSGEAAAAWLAVMGLPDVTCVNRLDAELWYTTSEWAVWRRRLEVAGVRLAPLSVGDVSADEPMLWLPWIGGMARPPGPNARRCFAAALSPRERVERAVWCDGRWISGRAGPAAADAVEVLDAHGVRLAEVLVSRHGVLACSAHPQLDERTTAIAANRIVEAFLADMHRR